ncbi:hypothetical protein SAMN05428975_3134 [Mucilaginibacter sp. OK268]|uniref:hypothetical protein n=1 Tax=Mucilaginibacter sp. OK268 TaxID=1881048 RepID=UPI000884862F|nr:hypothetical protein [Mucilaginibacter sp. OK268]SDP86490.1 hypothetical protein SAMN05428975_3134 [Mucilaginibacter sp. OK268]
MSKKIFSLILVAFLCGVVYFGWIYGWLSFEWNTDTPKAFINHTVPSQQVYQEDKRSLAQAFMVQLKSRKDFFNDSSFSDSTTTIIIDTIVYSSDFRKMGILVIAKNPTYKQIIPQKDTKWFYNSTCYLGMRRDTCIDLKMCGPTFTNTNNLKDASYYIREGCFRRFVVKNNGVYPFNLNDKRFWESKTWQHYFD